jgi:hypothetical protein
MVFRDQVIRRLVGQHSDHRVQEAHLDVLPVARALTLDQGSQKADDAMEAGEDIRKCDSQPARPA